MMVQHSYIDCSPKPLGHKWSRQFKSTIGRTWCQGNALITVQKAEGEGYEIIFRRPVGITVFYAGINNELGNMKFNDRNRAELQRPSISTDISSRSMTEASFKEFHNLTAEGENFLLDSNDDGFSNLDYDSSYFDPSFLILQFQPFPILNIPDEFPKLLKIDESTLRAISVLDRTPSIDLHKIGVVYVAPGQINESDILSNTAGSKFYTDFLLDLGQFVSLSNNRDVYTGGLDTSTDCFDGQYAILFVPDQRLTQMIFHVTTLMPSFEHDPSRTAKKRHIGNDFVMIVWNEGGRDYDRNTIPSQFNLVQIIIEPMNLEKFKNVGYQSSTFKVIVWFRSDIPIPAPLPIVISGISLGSFVRQIAMYYNMIAQVFTSGEASSNAKERLRQIKRLKSRLEPTNLLNSLDFSYLTRSS